MEDEEKIVFIGYIGKKEVILQLTKDEAKELEERNIALPITDRTKKAIRSEKSNRRNRKSRPDKSAEERGTIYLF